MSFEIFTEEDRQQERELLATYDLDIGFFKKLGLKIKQIVPERGCFRIETDKGFFCLKKMTYSFQDIFLMHEMTAHLQNNGFDNVSKIVRQPDGGILVPYQGSEYYLTHWMDGRESDYLNLSDIKESTEALAKLHIASKAFGTKLNTSNRQLYGRWREAFLQKLKDIDNARMHVDADSRVRDNRQIVSDYLKHCEQDVKHTLELLDRMDYDGLNARDKKEGGFIHHDYGLYNITHTFDGETFIGGLESAAFDIRMHDLAYLIFKLMRRRAWDMDLAMAMIEFYDGMLKLEKRDYQALTVYLSMPHDCKQFQRLYYTAERDLEDVEELERINIHSEYSTARRQLLCEMEKNAGFI